MSAGLSEAGELAERPGASAVAGGVDAAREREMPRRAQLSFGIEPVEILRPVERRQRFAAERLEVRIPLLRGRVLAVPCSR